MADWYVSSAAYSGYTAFQGAHTYSIGDLIVPTAPANKAKWVFRCTTGGLSTTEPTWNTANNGTSTSGTAVFTNITGQSAFFWTAAAGDIQTLLAGTPRFTAGDRMFVSSDHTETQVGNVFYGSGPGGTTSYSSGQVISVNRAGSTPPVAADLLAGATCTVTSNSLEIDNTFPVYHYGINFIYTGSAGGFFFGSSGTKTTYFDTCTLYLNTSTSSAKINTNASNTLILSNSTIRFGAVSQNINPANGTFEIIWFNTPSALAGAIFPTNLISLSNSVTPVLIAIRGVDLSALTTTLATNGASASGGKLLLDSCKIASGLTRYSATSVSNTRDEVELVNCYNGSIILSERYTPAGTLTTETTIVLTGGATDNTGTFSHKMVSTVNVDKFANTFDSFWMDVNNTLTGSSKTATVEIISSATLNNDEISLWLEYEGTASSSVASFVNSFIATPMSTPAAVTSSAASWASSPATPVTQKLQVTFTPQTAGRVRGKVRLGKASTTVYINPQLTIT